MPRQANSSLFRMLLCMLLPALTTYHAVADVRLPHIFGSNMVLQCGVPAPVWGWASPGEEITITFGDAKMKTTANAKGEWMAKLPPQAAADTPSTLEVAGNNTIVFDNVLVGEVWLCSGQSNMQMGIATCGNAKEDIAKADYPSLRLFKAKLTANGEPQYDCTGEWMVCSPETLGIGDWSSFSGAAYYFGEKLHRELNTPVGLIQSAWGGTRIETWTPPVGFAQVPELKELTESLDKTASQYRNELTPKLDEIETWVNACKSAIQSGAPIPPRPQWPRHPLDTEAFTAFPPTAMTCLYNAMIQPLVPYAIRGAIWYQGESNVGDLNYTDKMKALIGGWRTLWDEGSFPFYYVQITPCALYGEDVPTIWEAQIDALSIPNTGIAGTLDLGELDNVHPANKRDVGKRLALCALAKTYGKKDIVYSGPMYKSMKIKKNKVQLSFEHTGSGLASRDGQPLNWFTIAGVDKQFVPAQAVIEKEKVIVWSDTISKPVAVRFAWDKLAQPNLMNKEGLPALPFRTDTDTSAH